VTRGIVELRESAEPPVHRYLKLLILLLKGNLTGYLLSIN